ncbi:MAG: lipopolysaccharide biosynthesis protein [Dechloromonas sp.]|nr:lipopolysaccharide biosynthesis protein [Dechloromonas sp.]
MMLTSKLAERGLGLISTLILARLLLPADFGLVAMAAPVVALVELLGALGMDSALIQRPDLKRSHLDTAFTIGLIVATAIALSLWLVAPFAAAYFREPRLEAIISWLALGNLIQGFGNPGFVLFRKEINMAPEVILLVAKKLTSLVVATVAAILIGNYWALVWGTLLSRIVGVGLSYAMTPFRPRLSLSERREVLGFSAWMLVVQLLYYLQLRANDLIIGRLMGASQLAYFIISIDLAASAPGEAMVAISRAAFPTFAKLSGDTQRLRMGLRNILSGVAILALPAGFGIAAVAELLVQVLLGERWMPAAEIVASLAISCAVLGILSQVSYVYMALGRPRVAAAVSALSVVALVGTSIAAIPTMGLKGVNIAYPAMAATVTFGHFVMLRQMLPEFRVSDWVAAFWRPLASAGLMLTVLKFIAQWMGPVQGSAAGIFPLTLLIAIGVAIYFCGLITLWRLSGSPDGPEAMAWTKLQSMLGNRFAK